MTTVNPEADDVISPDELARRSLQRMVAQLVDELYWAIDDERLTREALLSIVGLWEANNLNEDLTYAALVEEGKPAACDGCRLDVMP